MPMPTMEVIDNIMKIVEVILRVVLAVGITGAVVWALATWMQNNPTLQKRRDKANMDAMKARIAQENAAQKNR